MFMSLLLVGVVVAFGSREHPEGGVRDQGIDKLAGVKSPKIMGGIVRGKKHLFSIIIRKEGEKLRCEPEVRGKKMVQVWDGHEGWISRRRKHAHHSPA